MISGITIIKYTDDYLNETIELFRKWSSDHPELCDIELFKWQKCNRYLALYKGKIIGHIAQSSHNSINKNQEIAIGWGATLVLDMSDLMVRTFAGNALLETILNNKSLTYAAVGIVPEIEQSYIRRGYLVRKDSAKMYARFFMPQKAINYYNKPSIYSLGIVVVNWLKPIRIARSENIESIKKFDEKWDPIWNKFLSEQYEFYGQRDSNYLNYKLSQPHKDYHAFIHRDQSRTIDGYIIYRLAKHSVKDLKLVKICDMVGSADAKYALITKAIEFAKEDNAYGIVSLGSYRDENIHKKCGLWISKAFPIAIDSKIRNKPHVTFFDSDLDELW